MPEPGVAYWRMAELEHVRVSSQDNVGTQLSRRPHLQPPKIESRLGTARPLVKVLAEPLGEL